MKISIDIPSNPSIAESAAKDIAEKFQRILNYAGVFDATVEIPCTTVVSVPGRGCGPVEQNIAYFLLRTAVEQNTSKAPSQEVTFTYTRADGITAERRLHPVHIDADHVQGYDVNDNGKFKTFTVRRIRNVRFA